MKKVTAAGIIVLVLAVAVFAFLGRDSRDTAEDREKPVRVMKVSSETTPVVLDYTGIVSPGEVRQMAFKSSGKIAGVYVEEGGFVKKGEMLAALDIKELLHAKDDAEQGLRSALDAFEFSRSVCQRMEDLYLEGAVSLQDLEKARLDRDLQKAVYNRAAVNMESIQSSIGDAVLVAETDAYVTDILFKEGEMAAAGYPVIILRSENLVVNAGLSEGDAAKVKPGTSVKVKGGGREIPGQVSFVDLVPDEETRTYNAKIAIQESPFKIGAVVSLEIILGEGEGIWIPLASVMADGRDYVYIVEDDRAVKTEVAIDGARSSRVRVKGLNPGDILVIEGYRNLKDGEMVDINW